MDFSSVESLKDAGFEGFISVDELSKRPDVTPNLHPVAIRAAASFSPTWAGEARGCVA